MFVSEKVSQIEVFAQAHLPARPLRDMEIAKV